jgi:hypothetical protein
MSDDSKTQPMPVEVNLEEAIRLAKSGQKPAAGQSSGLDLAVRRHR